MARGRGARPGAGHAERRAGGGAVDPGDFAVIGGVGRRSVEVFDRDEVHCDAEGNLRAAANEGGAGAAGNVDGADVAVAGIEYDYPTPLRRKGRKELWMGGLL